MKKTVLKSNNCLTISCFVKGMLPFMFFMLFATSMQAQSASITTMDAQNEKGEFYTALKVNNPTAFHWYVLFSKHADGSYQKLQSLASDGTSFSFSVKLDPALAYKVYTYTSRQYLPSNAPGPQDIPVGQIPPEE
jgi:hypothetical protein